MLVLYVADILSSYNNIASFSTVSLERVFITLRSFYNKITRISQQSLMHMLCKYRIILQVPPSLTIMYYLLASAARISQHLV